MNEIGVVLLKLSKLTKRKYIKRRGLGNKRYYQFPYRSCSIYYYPAYYPDGDYANKVFIGKGKTGSVQKSLVYCETPKSESSWIELKESLRAANQFFQSENEKRQQSVRIKNLKGTL